MTFARAINLKGLPFTGLFVFFKVTLRHFKDEKN